MSRLFFAKHSVLVLLLLFLMIQGCSKSSSSSCSLGSGPNVSITGQVTFDRVQHDINGGLDYGNITREPGKGLVIEAICNSIIDTKTTDSSGNFLLEVPANTNGVLVRVKAQMKASGAPSWDFKVVDNSRAQALFVMDSSRFNSGDSGLVLDLHADSGWTGSSYTETRVAAPFAILDTVYDAMQLILAQSPNAIFPLLKLNWNSNNTIGTFYNGSEIFILGKANNDTDEYDEHVIAHEWGHYFQDVFSRDDSIGGDHSGGDILDIRLAFSEGFGNAFSAIVTGDSIYKDAQGTNQNGSDSFRFNLENNSCSNPGWYSECSIQSIFFDLYDGTSFPDSDNAFYGFAPLYEVMTGDMPGYSAFTSIFSFIHPLKLHPDVSATSGSVDTLVNAQSINTISDVYGSNETILTSGNTAIYANSSTILCSTGKYQGYNGLGVYRFLRTTGTGSSVTFIANKSGSSGMTPADPDLVLYRNGEIVQIKDSIAANSESLTASLDTGQEYILGVHEYQYKDPDYVPNASLDETCFDITITP